jgi:anaerobic dimethyl sulfoxide reductase subunit B (iron-sulfur subunit)
MTSQFAFLVNSDACSGCKTCQVACKDKHDLPAGVHWRKVYEITAGEWQEKDGIWVSTVLGYHLSTACHHCLNPLCAAPCPTEAIWKEDSGIVRIDASLCRNCRACMLACPYGAIYFNPAQNTTTKCDFCQDSLELGLTPACVAACPNRALDFGEYEELKRNHAGVNQVYPMAASSSAAPALVILPHRHAIAAANRTPGISNREEV